MYRCARARACTFLSMTISNSSSFLSGLALNTRPSSNSDSLRVAVQLLLLKTTQRPHRRWNMSIRADDHVASRLRRAGPRSTSQSAYQRAAPSRRRRAHDASSSPFALHRARSPCECTVWRTEPLVIRTFCTRVSCARDTGRDVTEIHDAALGKRRGGTEVRVSRPGNLSRFGGSGALHFLHSNHEINEIDQSQYLEFQLSLSRNFFSIVPLVLRQISRYVIYFAVWKTHRRPTLSRC